MGTVDFLGCSRIARPRAYRGRFHSSSGTAVGCAVALAAVLSACGDDGQPGLIGGTTGLGFTPTNVAAIPAGTAPLTLSGTCEVDTSDGSISCADPGAYGFALATQTDGSTPVAVFACGDLTVATGATVSVVGPNPAVFVAMGSIRVQGLLAAAPNGFVNGQGRAGGFSPGTTPLQPGQGPGAGGAGSDGVGAGGGGYCGTGGGAGGGAPYGNNVVEPLVGGSSGGNGAVGTAGAGGGAIQLVARDEIRILAGGAVHAGGAGGNFGGAPTSQPAAGGGSGGAILLEAPTVSIAGAVAANGGGGGAVGSGNIPTAGAYATPDDVSAPGGSPNGGAGAAGAAADGSAGTDHAGGGGAAGWVRINSSSGAAAVSGVVSPDFATGCATEGVLAP